MLILSTFIFRTIIMTSKTELYSTSRDMVIVPDNIKNDATQQKTSNILTTTLSPKKNCPYC